MDKSKPAARVWVMIGLILVPALYLLSFGPVCWKLNGGNSAMIRAFAPLAWLTSNGPPVISVPLLWYARLGIPPDKRLNLPTANDGSSRTSWPSRSDPVQD